MNQLKSLHPNFFLFGSVGIEKADSPILGWQLGITHVFSLGRGTDESEYIGIHN